VVEEGRPAGRPTPVVEEGRLAARLETTISGVVSRQALRAFLNHP
jgi:hypothetical protein